MDVPVYIPSWLVVKFVLYHVLNIHIRIPLNFIANSGRELIFNFLLKVQNN